jgi:hypothetical protein
MTETGFTAKERVRFRKLLEVAHSTTYSGERDAAMSAALRLATAHGMTLREAAGITEASAPTPHQKPRRPSRFKADFDTAGAENVGMGWKHQQHPVSGPAQYKNEIERVAAEKERLSAAREDAILRGLDAEEHAAAARAAASKGRLRVRPGKRGAWRTRPEFIRVLLTETAMSAKDIAAAAGVTVNEVFREKLLMRRAANLSS